MLRLASRFLASLPTPVLLALGRVIGTFWFHVVPLRRGDALRAVAQAFPDRSPAEQRRIVKESFVHLARSLLEVIAFVTYPTERLRSLVRFEGLAEPVLAARAAGRGTVCLSAHIGSFELSMGAFHLLTGVPIVIVARIPKAGFARRVLEAVRDRVGMLVLPPKGSLPRAVAALTEETRILGFVTDQNMPRKRGVFVEFFGRPACTTPGFSVIARRSGAAVVAGWNERLGDGTHLGHFGEITLSKDPDPRVAALADTWRLTQETERWIRARPEQWFWVHRRWKTQPETGDLVRTRAGLVAHGQGRVAMLLDRDGVLNRELGRSVLAPEELELVPGAAEGVRRLNEAGVAAIVITNQACVGRGRIDEAMLGRIHAHLAVELQKLGARLDGILYCPHHPTEGQGAYRIACDCRKPLPGLVNRAIREHGLNPALTAFVGDRESDVKAARAAGIRSIMVSNGWAHEQWRAPAEAADVTAASLPDAVGEFLGRVMGRGE